jgi:hypothetical protein
LKTKSLLFNLKSPLFGALSGLALTLLLFLLMNWHNPNANYFNSVIEPSRSAWGLAETEVDGPFERLLFGWSAKQFRPFMFADMGETMPQQAAAYWQNIPVELAMPLLLLAVVGVVYLLARQWQTAVLLFAVLPIFQPQQEAFAAGDIPFAFDEYPIYDANIRQIAAAVVLDLPQNAILFTDWDMMWPYYYAAVVENGRTDLTFIETYPADDQEAIADSVLEYVAAHLAEHPIYFSERDAALLEAGYAYSPARVGPARLVKINGE